MIPAPDYLTKATCRVYDDGFAGEGWDGEWLSKENTNLAAQILIGNI